MTTKLPNGLPPTWPPDLGMNGGSPWWVKLAVYFGPAILAAGFLIWFVTQTVATSIAGMSHKLDDHISVTGFYMRQVCLNTAQTDSQARACLPPHEREQ